MSQALTDSKTSPTISGGGDDSRNLAIIYGSLGTLIAFATLIVAVLSWMRSHRQKLDSQHQANGDIEMQSSPSKYSSHAKEDHRTTTDNHKYAIHKSPSKTAAEAHLEQQHAPNDVTAHCRPYPSASISFRTRWERHRTIIAHQRKLPSFRLYRQLRFSVSCSSRRVLLAESLGSRPQICLATEDQIDFETNSVYKSQRPVFEEERMQHSKRLRS